MSRLDPGISLAVKPVQIESPVDVIGRVLQMRDFLTKEQLQRQEIATGQENARRIGLESQALERKQRGLDLYQQSIKKNTSLDIQIDPQTHEISGSGVHKIDHAAVQGEMYRNGFPELVAEDAKSQKEVDDAAYNEDLRVHQKNAYDTEEKAKVAQAVLAQSDPLSRTQALLAGTADLKRRGITNDSELAQFGLNRPYSPEMDKTLQFIVDKSTIPQQVVERMQKARQEARAEETHTADIKLKGAQTEEAQTRTLVEKQKLGGPPQTFDEFQRRLLPMFGGNANDPEYKRYLSMGQIEFSGAPLNRQNILEQAGKQQSDIAEAKAKTIAEAGPKLAEAEALEKFKTGNDPRLENVPPNDRKDVLDKVQKANDEWNTASQAGDDMKTFIDQIRAGNKQAAAYIDTEGVLTLNTGRGVKRVNSAEIGSYGSAGSIYDRVVGALKKGGEGIGKSDSIINDIERLHQEVTGNAQRAYERKVRSINQTYNSTFQPLTASAAPAQPATGGAGGNTDMIAVQIPGQPPGQIHSTQWEAFKKKYPNAERVQ